jgi:DNA repair protein RecO (recombination protein O)
VHVYARRLPRRGATFAASLEPLQAGELSYVRTSEGGPGRFFTFLPQRVWPGIRSDFDRTVHALAFLELVAVTLTEGEPQEELFELLVRFLNRLECDNRPEAARMIATLRLLAVCGFSPELQECTGCQAPVSPGSVPHFSSAAGGALCRACARSRGEGAVSMTRAAHAFMSRALSMRGDQSLRLSAHVAVTAEVSRLLTPFIEHRTGVRLRAPDFFEKLRAPGRTRRFRA